ncbi:hypothetical protein SEA_RUMMER_6 [Mycobacterium phage Rummer]|nr:hypothetical protein SEA_RUMMER_6 [Mycobacterium phage Rummer]
MTNPTNTEDYDFFFCFETKGLRFDGPGDPDTWYANMQPAGPGADGEPPAFLVQTYLNLLPQESENLRISIRYVPTVAWTQIDPEDVDNLPGTVGNYTFGGLTEYTEGELTATAGVVADGEYGRDYAALAYQQYSALASEPDAPYSNPRVVYVPLLTYSTWDIP